MVSLPWRCWYRLLVPVQAWFILILRLTITGFAENCKWWTGWSSGSLPQDKTMIKLVLTAERNTSRLNCQGVASTAKINIEITYKITSSIANCFTMMWCIYSLSCLNHPESFRQDFLTGDA